MNFRRTSTLFIVIFVITVAIMMSHARVEATRVLFEDFSSVNHLETQLFYEKAKHTMASWLERLPSGPSDRGAGH
ncbi:hypothetical protein I3843_01G163700 [Carya illinoinensis]|nr:hypothetical protein I3843_01G163700 [Carya illinoinensis]